MTRQQRYEEVRRQAEKREKEMPRRRRRAVIVRILYVAGVVACLALAVAGTRPREAARIKRWVSAASSVFRDDSVVFPSAGTAGEVHE